MNLVMIGQFESIEEAEKAKDLIETVTEKIYDKVDCGENRPKRFSNEVMDIFREKNLYIFGPEELEQFRYDHSLDIEGNKIIFRTAESDISVFLKLLIHQGAKVQVYSAHNYPDEEYGRGK
ncbi:DUF6375 family protein [Microbulbifer elongatus]|nr:DUF6375 family protein [Microbulbifer elongatus]